MEKIYKNVGILIVVISEWFRWKSFVETNEESSSICYKEPLKLQITGHFFGFLQDLKIQFPELHIQKLLLMWNLSEKFATLAEGGCANFTNSRGHTS